MLLPILHCHSFLLPCNKALFLKSWKFSNFSIVWCLRLLVQSMLKFLKRSKMKNSSQRFVLLNHHFICTSFHFMTDIDNMKWPTFLTCLDMSACRQLNVLWWVPTKCITQKISLLNYFTHNITCGPTHTIWYFTQKPWRLNPHHFFPPHF